MKLNKFVSAIGLAVFTLVMIKKVIDEISEVSKDNFIDTKNPDINLENMEKDSVDTSQEVKIEELTASIDSQKTEEEQVSEVSTPVLEKKVRKSRAKKMNEEELNPKKIKIKKKQE